MSSCRTFSAHGCVNAAKDEELARRKGLTNFKMLCMFVSEIHSLSPLYFWISFGLRGWWILFESGKLFYTSHLLEGVRVPSPTTPSCGTYPLLCSLGQELSRGRSMLSCRDAPPPSLACLLHSTVQLHLEAWVRALFLTMGTFLNTLAARGTLHS